MIEILRFSEYFADKGQGDVSTVFTVTFFHQSLEGSVTVLLTFRIRIGTRTD